MWREKVASVCFPRVTSSSYPTRSECLPSRTASLPLLLCTVDWEMLCFARQFFTDLNFRCQGHPRKLITGFISLQRVQKGILVCEIWDSCYRSTLVRATPTKDGTRCGGKKGASISMERSLDTFNTYCIVLLTFGFLKNCAATSVPAFSARKFTVFLFIVAAAL